MRLLIVFPFVCFDLFDLNFPPIMDVFRVGTLNVNWTSHYSWTSSMLLSRTYRDRGLQASMARHLNVTEPIGMLLTTCYMCSMKAWSQGPCRCPAGGRSLLFCQKWVIEKKKNSALCLSCVSMLKFNSSLCAPFKAHRGCDLSGMLYALSLKPLLGFVQSLIALF